MLKRLIRRLGKSKRISPFEEESSVSKLDVKVPEKRSSLLYVRIKKSNVDFLKKKAKEQKTTMTEYVDALLDSARGA